MALIIGNFRDCIDRFLQRLNCASFKPAQQISRWAQSESQTTNLVSVHRQIGRLFTE